MATSAPRGAERPKTTTEWAQQEIAGTFDDPAEAAKRLRLAAEHCHLVGGTSIAPLVEGHEILIAVVPITRAQCYPANPAAKSIARGNAPKDDDDAPMWGIGKADLMTLATAAGVEWTYSRRQDDASDPLYCHWRVLGRYRLIDGTWRVIEGDRDVDTRDNSPEMASKTANQVTALRETVMRNAITKAKLRAIREGFGVPHAMLTEELEKPFVLSRMVFTGRSNDPEVRRLFAAGIMQQHLAASGALYGARPVAAIGSAPAPLGMLTAPSPAEPMHDIDEPPSSPGADEPPESDPAPPPPPRNPPPAAAQSRASAPVHSQRPAQGRPPRGGWVMPGKAGKGDAGKPLSEARDDSLEWWINRLESNLENGETPHRYVDRDRALAAAMREELDRRHGVVPAGEEPEGGPY